MSDVKFIRKDGRVIPITGAGGMHPANVKHVNRIAKEHGITVAQVKAVGSNRGINFKAKMDGDEVGDLEMHSERAFGNTPTSRANFAALLRGSKK